MLQWTEKEIDPSSDINKRKIQWSIKIGYWQQEINDTPVIIYKITNTFFFIFPSIDIFFYHTTKHPVFLQGVVRKMFGRYGLYAFAKAIPSKPDLTARLWHLTATMYVQEGILLVATVILLSALYTITYQIGTCGTNGTNFIFLLKIFEILFWRFPLLPSAQSFLLPAAMSSLQKPYTG